MSKQYNTKLQERLEKFLKDENLSQAKAAPDSWNQSGSTQPVPQKYVR